MTGQDTYENDLVAMPFYQNGERRLRWDALPVSARAVWADRSNIEHLHDDVVVLTVAQQRAAAALTRIFH